MASAVAAPLRRTRVAATVLWRFSRPHTIIGTALSVAGIFAIAADELGPLPAGRAAFHLFWTLVAALAVNVFIVGLNQVEDVEIDRINKPRLPLAAGDLTMRQGKLIVATAAAVPLLLALTQGLTETIAVTAAMAIGWAYSSKPLHLKRFPVAAAGAITIVRSVVVNLGVYLHFRGAFGGEGIPDAIVALTLFVVPFAFAIAVLKDVPDLEGDRRFGIRTFTVRLGPQAAFRLGLTALTLGYAGMIAFGPGPAAHAVALVLLWWWARRAFEDFTGFYMRVWGLFFAEYLVVPAAVLLG